MFYPQRLEGREELEVSCIEGRFKILQEQATEQTGENTHGQKEIRSGGNPTGTIERRTATGNNDVQMRMMD